MAATRPTFDLGWGGGHIAGLVLAQRALAKQTGFAQYVAGSQLGRSKSPFFQLFKRKKRFPGIAKSMLKLVRTLPKILKYLPSDKAQDARLYILGLQFWLGGSPNNLQNFLKMIFGSYVPALKGTKIEYFEPVMYLDSGIWYLWLLVCTRM